MQTIYDLIQAQAERDPEAVALVAPDRVPTTFGRLFSQICATLGVLNSFGLGRNDRIAIMVPSVPEMAVAVLSISSIAASAPLNPTYRARELELYFSELEPSALVIQSGIDSPAFRIAQQRKIPVIELSPIRHGAGLFALSGKPQAQTGPMGLAQPNDKALLLQTSGTTARPKIVPLTQSNICASVNVVRETLHLDSHDRSLNIMPLFHIHGLIAGLLASLASGGSVICPPGFYAPSFFDWMDQFRPTWYTAVPTMHRAILNHAAANRVIIEGCPLRFIRSSSIALSIRLKSELESAFNAPVIEAYGMTEGAHQIASNPLPPQHRKPGSVGLATGSQIAIVDEAGSRLPLGQTGQVAIRGDNVTLGYLDDPAANAAAFSNGWLLTGDLGYMDSENYLFIVGRIKELINRAGEKISPPEVEQALTSHPAIEQATVFSVPDPTTGEGVAAAIVLKKGESATGIAIQEFASTLLADFKVPRQIVFLTELPRGASGKPQRVGLAEKLGLITRSAPAPHVAYIAPRNDIERALAAIWSEVLRVEHIGIRDHFIALGGDSILAALIVSRIRRDMHCDLSIVFLLDETATIESTASAIEQIQPEPAESKAADLGDQRIPLSNAQGRLWFLSQFAGGGLAYQRASAFRVIGELNTGALEQSLNELIQRHETLRTNFYPLDGMPFQRILPFRKLGVKQIDLREIPNSDRESKARRRIIDEAQVEFDFAQDPLIRFVCLQMSELDRILVLITHHIVFDGWSEDIFFNELAQGYNAFSGNQSHCPAELPIRYADYARWQFQTPKEKQLDQDLLYWKERLGENLPIMELPADLPLPSKQTFQGARHYSTIPKTTLNSMRELCRAENITLFMGLLTVFKILLYRYSAQEDIVVGMPVAGRNRAEFENLIGTFVNTLVLRTDLSGEPSCLELFARVKTVALSAFAHQDFPFERLVQELQPSRESNRNPLHQTIFQLRNMPKSNWTMRGLHIEEYPIDLGTTHYELSLDTYEQPDGLACRFEYSTDLFHAATIERMAGHFQTLLEAVVAHPEHRISELPILTLAEQQQMAEWNKLEQVYPYSKCIHQLFEEQVERAPNAVAIMIGDDRLTYSELNRRANQLAHYLQTLGVGPDVLVGLCIDRSLEMMVGLLGILKAGGAYVPLDPVYPRDRLAIILADAQVPVIVSHSDLLSKLSQWDAQIVWIDNDWPIISQASQQNPMSPVIAENLAYVIYTSGSTGKPKGVMIEHRQVVRLFQASDQWFHFDSADVWTLYHSYAFDFSVWEMWGALLYGGRLILVPYLVSRTPDAFYDLVCEQGVTVLNQTPSAFYQFEEVVLATRSRTDHLRLVIFGGEMLEPHRLRPWFDKRGEEHPQLVNMYGITETTVHVTYRPLTKKDANYSLSAIGMRIPDLKLYLLDDHQQPVPIGIKGEIYVGGAGLARGYLNQVELTQTKFIPDLFSREPGSRLYRSGDLARYLPEGDLVFLGRSDNQVKIRGYRIELGEIEFVLGEHPAVRHCAVIAREDTHGTKRLIAYVVPRARDAAEDSELRQFVKTRLPDYMVPSAIMLVDALPLSPNGKIDRLALPAPENAARAVKGAFIAPRNRFELALAQIWQEVLGVSPIGATDNFFDLGGHSLLALRLFAEIEKIYGRKFPVRILFEAATVERFASLLQKEGWQPKWSCLVPIRPQGFKPPLFYIPPLNAVLNLGNLANHLGSDQPVYGLLASPDGDHNPFERIEDEAAFYITQMKTIQPHGGYYLAGWSYGGKVAYEIAQQLVSKGQTVAFLAMLDVGFNLDDLHSHTAHSIRRFDYLRKLGLRALIGRAFNRIRRRRETSPASADIFAGDIVGNDWKGDRRRSLLYAPRPYSGKVILFRTLDRSPHQARDPLKGLGRLARGGLEVYDVDGDHGTMLSEPHLRGLAEKLRACLARAQEQNQ